MAPASTQEMGLMRAAALECSSIGIRVNTVNPATIETRMIHSLEKMCVASGGDAPQTVDELKQDTTSRIPLQRYGEPEELGKLMLFLASYDSSF